MSKFEDLTDRKFNRLTVIKRIENHNNRIYYLCQCDCGNYIKVMGKNLKNNNTKSCGCLQKEKVGNLNKTHNLSNSRIYKLWLGIKKRCYNSKSKSYLGYGSRGIIMYDEWLNDFMSFYNWSMSNGYKEDLSIDRIDVNGNYEPNNCRWVTQKEQCNNRSNNHLINYNGETYTLSEWSNKLNINRGTLNSRINKLKWTVEKAFTQKVKVKNVN